MGTLGGRSRLSPNGAATVLESRRLPTFKTISIPGRGAAAMADKPDNGTNQEKRLKSLFSESLVLAGIPAAAYGVAYGMEVGFCREFRIPRYLITIELTDVIIALTGLLTPLGILFLAARFLYSRLRRSRAGFRAGVRVAFLLLLCGLAVVVMTFPRLPTLSELGATVLAAMALRVVWHTLNIVVEDKDSQTRMTASYNLVELQAALVLLLLVALVVSPVLGRGVARRQTEFLVSTTTKDLVVLRQYGDYWVVGTLSTDSTYLEPEFRIVSLSAASTLSEAEPFRLANVGPLRPSDD